MTYGEILNKTYGWPVKIHTRGYDAYLVDAQPISLGVKLPVYRFPGGESLVDECEWKPFVKTNNEQV